MKKIMVTLLIVILASTAWAIHPQTPVKKGVVDQYGNRVVINDWTWFGYKPAFKHPNGCLYGDIWVHTEEIRYNKFQGWLTIAGLGWGLYDSGQKNYFKHWNSFDNLRDFSARLVGGWFWGYCLDSPNPNACRWAGAVTGSIWAIDTAYDDLDLFWERGPNWQEAGIIAGEIASCYLIGWLCDIVRPKPESRYSLKYTLQKGR